MYWVTHFGQSYRCTQYDRLLASYCCQSVCMSVCLSVTKYIVAKRYILQQVSEQANRKWLSSRNTILQLSTSTPTHPSNSPLNHRRSRHLVTLQRHRYIKTYCEQLNRQNYHVWNSHRQHASRLFQKTLCDRLLFSNSRATCQNSFTDSAQQYILR